MEKCKSKFSKKWFVVELTQVTPHKGTTLEESSMLNSIKHWPRCEWDNAIASYMLSKRYFKTQVTKQIQHNIHV